MWLAFRGLEFEKIVAYFKSANYLWVLIAAIFGLFAYWFRAIRWNLLLEPMGYSIKNSSALWTISFGYLMNLTIPRSGELARSTALYSLENVPVNKSFGTIILERVVDLCCMVLFLGLTLFFKYDAIEKFYHHAFSGDSGKSGSKDNVVLYSVIGIVLVFSLLFYLFRQKLSSNPFISKVSKFLNGIWQGIISIFKLKQPLKFIAYSLAIWVCYYLGAYLVCFAIEPTAHFTPADGFFIIVVGTLGMMVPASGGIGAFHFALKIGIGALFLSQGKSFEEGAEVGLAYAFISHTMQLALMALMGFISIPMLARLKAKFTENKNRIHK